MQHCEDRAADRTHKELLLPMVMQLCHQAELSLTDLQAVVCGAGPGSFTGVRIGVAAAQGLALAADCPVLTVNSLDVLALSAFRAAEISTQPDVALICARRSRGQAYYLAAYLPAAGHRDLLPERTPMSLCENSAEFERWLSAQAGLRGRDMRLCGERPPWLSEAVCVGLGDTALQPTARCTLELGLSGLAKGLAVAPGSALPVYLPEDSPWQPSASES